MECEELCSCSSVCDAFVWGAVSGVSDALETLFARAVFGGYEGGASWGGAWLEHERWAFSCVRIYGVRYGACVIAALALARAVLLFAYAFICGGAARGVGMGC